MEAALELIGQCLGVLAVLGGGCYLDRRVAERCALSPAPLKWPKRRAFGHKRRSLRDQRKHRRAAVYAADRPEDRTHADYLAERPFGLKPTLSDVFGD